MEDLLKTIEQFLEFSDEKLEDTVQLIEDIHQEMWLKPGFTLYDKANINGAKKINTTVAPYTKVNIVQIVQTVKGTFAQIEGQGWVSMEFLDETDNRSITRRTTLSMSNSWTQAKKQA